MNPDFKPPLTTSEPITIDLGLNRLIQRVDTNITQEIMVITADKARLCLMHALARMERRNAWIAPAGILATLVVIFPTTTFQDFLGLSKDFWKALISFAAIGAVGWLVVSLVRIERCLTIEQIVDQLRTDSLSVPERPVAQATQSDLFVIEAFYGTKEKKIDVTEFLRRESVGNGLRVPVGNEIGGDPCPGALKELKVKYRYKDKEHEITCPEGGQLKLP